VGCCLGSSSGPFTVLSTNLTVKTRPFLSTIVLTNSPFAFSMSDGFRSSLAKKLSITLSVPSSSGGGRVGSGTRVRCVVGGSTTGT